MDFARDLTEHERYQLGLAARHDEIDDWLSDRVKMRLIRPIAGGFGTVYCVPPFPPTSLTGLVVRQMGQRSIPARWGETES
jgi:hypothetical protein